MYHLALTMKMQLITCNEYIPPHPCAAGSHRAASQAYYRSFLTSRQFREPLYRVHARQISAHASHLPAK